MIIVDNSLDTKMDIVKELLNNKKSFFIMVNNEFTYNYIMQFFYQKEINWLSGKDTMSKERGFSWYKKLYVKGGIKVAYEKNGTLERYALGGTAAFISDLPIINFKEGVIQ